MLGSLEEGGALVGFMAELMTEDAESAWGVIKAAGDLGRRQFIQKIGAEGFVLAVKRGFGSEKELGLTRVRWFITSSDAHKSILLSYSAIVNPLWKTRAETTAYCACQL